MKCECGRELVPVQVVEGIAATDAWGYPGNLWALEGESRNPRMGWACPWGHGDAVLIDEGSDDAVGAWRARWDELSDGGGARRALVGPAAELEAELEALRNTAEMNREEAAEIIGELKAEVAQLRRQLGLPEPKALTADALLGGALEEKR